MEITKTRTLKVNMGNWEHDEAFFRVTVNTEDLLLAGIKVEGMNPADVADLLIALADTKIESQIEKFLDQCRKLTANEDSFSLVLPPAPSQPAEAPPAKAKRRIRRP